MDTQSILEAILLSANRPLSLDQLFALFAEEEGVTRDHLKESLDALGERLLLEHRPVELKRVASGYRLQVKENFSPWISKLFEERPGRYSRAFLETLAIIAYRQPATRGEIEDIRGVSVNSNIIKQLQEREWIHTVGHKEVPGRPELLATTRHFLDYFGLTSLSDLPPLQEFLDRLDDSLPTDEIIIGAEEHDLNRVDAETTPEHSTPDVEEEHLTHEEE